MIGDADTRKDDPCAWRWIQKTSVGEGGEEVMMAENPDYFYRVDQVMR